MKNTTKISLIALNSKYIHSNLAVRYIKNYLKKKNIEADILEFSINDNFDNIMKQIYLSKSNILGFSCYIWNREIIMKLGPSIKKIMPDTKILLGGPEVSYDIKSTLEENSWIDFIIFGEGEETFYQFANLFQEGSEEYKNIDGLAYKIKGEVQINKARKPISNLDKIPFPYENYDELKHRIIYYETSRGCPFNCQYCLSSIEHGVRYFSLERVYKDIDTFINNKVKQVKLVDRTFNCHKERCIKIMEHILSRKGSTNFHFEISAKLVDSDFINTVKKAPKGIFQFEIGVQSTNDDTLKAITRNESFIDIKNNILKLIDMGNCHIHLDLIAGLPFEDIKSFEKSFNDTYSLRPHMLQLGFLKLLRGSRLRDNAKQHGIIYNQHPPYEVLFTKFLSYNNILDLKTVEEMVEIFYNSGRFKKSLQYIMDEYYDNPFKFFKDLGDFYSYNNVLNKPLKTSKHYEMLYKFVENKLQMTQVFNELLKFDFFVSFGSNMPTCIKRYDHSKIKKAINEFLKKEENIIKYMPEFICMDIRQKFKYMRFEVFDIDVLGDLNKEKHIVFCINNPINKEENRILSFKINELLK